MEETRIVMLSHRTLGEGGLYADIQEESRNHLIGFQTDLTGQHAIRIPYLVLEQLVNKWEELKEKKNIILKT